MMTMRRGNQDSPNVWLPVSDLMSGLMIVFLFIAVNYMVQEQTEKALIRELAEDYAQFQDSLYQALAEEFNHDLHRWNAVLNRDTLAIRFEEPEVLFPQGRSEMRVAFAEILADFFPRYIEIMRRPEFVSEITEIRVEGHTSTEWNEDVAEERAYILNMELSQDRTRAVLAYVLSLRPIRGDESVKTWIRSRLTANGLSSSKPIRSNGVEDRDASRRVEFRVRGNPERQLRRVQNRLSGVGEVSD